jgi:hypothetical protein
VIRRGGRKTLIMGRNEYPRLRLPAYTMIIITVILGRDYHSNLGQKRKTLRNRKAAPFSGVTEPRLVLRRIRVPSPERYYYERAHCPSLELVYQQR